MASEPVAGSATPLLYSIPEAARLLSLGRSKTYELIGSGRLRTVSVGRRRLVSACALAEFVETLNADDLGAE
jgi:excisionase family DNA binding protein